MAKGFKKQKSSLAFSLKKAYERIITAKPSLFIVSATVVAITIFFLGGGVYNILIQPLGAFISQTGQIIAFYPGLSDQFVLGSIIIMISYTIGVAGFLFAYRSTKYAYNPRQAYMYLLIGSLGILIGYLLVELRIVSLFG